MKHIKPFTPKKTKDKKVEAYFRKSFRTALFSNAKDRAALKELQQIPGVGKCIAADLYSLGIGSVSELSNRNPEDLYRKLCSKQGTHIDRCVLYVFRCAVYFASHKTQDPRLLKWWN